MTPIRRDVLRAIVQIFTLLRLSVTSGNLRRAPTTLYISHPLPSRLCSQFLANLENRWFLSSCRCMYCTVLWFSSVFTYLPPPFEETSEVNFRRVSLISSVLFNWLLLKFVFDGTSELRLFERMLWDWPLGRVTNLYSWIFVCYFNVTMSNLIFVKIQVRVFNPIFFIYFSDWKSRKDL